MKKFFLNLTFRQILSGVVVILCLCLWGGLTLFADQKKNSLVDQTAASRWSDQNDTAQVTCYFTEKTEITTDQIMTFGMAIKKALQEASITQENEKLKLWIDAYSAPGTVTLVNQKAKMEAKAIGVGGEFFYFHPLELVTGTYFSGTDLMKDKVIIDEEAAWQLFGSSDVAGMTVEIGGIPHLVSGVVRRPQGRLAENAGLSKGVVYTSVESLAAYGTTTGINTYEVVMPNPVKGYAYTTIKEKFGIDENQMWVIDNTVRFEMKGLLTVISEFGTRSMQSYAINFPYWENVARGWEDILATVLILQFLSLTTAALIVICKLVSIWRRRRWRMKDILHFAENLKDHVSDKFHNEKSKWKYF